MRANLRKKDGSDSVDTAALQKIVAEYAVLVSRHREKNGYDLETEEAMAKLGFKYKPNPWERPEQYLDRLFSIQKQEKQEKSVLVATQLTNWSQTDNQTNDPGIGIDGVMSDVQSKIDKLFLQPRPTDIHRPKPTDVPKPIPQPRRRMIR